MKSSTPSHFLPIPWHDFTFLGLGDSCLPFAGDLMTYKVPGQARAEEYLLSHLPVAKSGQDFLKALSTPT